VVRLTDRAGGGEACQPYRLNSIIFVPCGWGLPDLALLEWHPPVPVVSTPHQATKFCSRHKKTGRLELFAPFGWGLNDSAPGGEASIAGISKHGSSPILKRL
jgi:hypothetical protein